MEFILSHVEIVVAGIALPATLLMIKARKAPKKNNNLTYLRVKYNKYREGVNQRSKSII